MPVQLVSMATSYKIFSLMKTLKTYLIETQLINYFEVLIFIKLLN